MTVQTRLASHYICLNLIAHHVFLQFSGLFVTLRTVLLNQTNHHTILSPHNLPDYVIKKFEFKMFTKIHGKPSVKSLLQLFREVKRNSQSVRTTLGGGQHGYLALIMDPVVYNSIPTTTAFNRPKDSEPFVIQ